MKQYLLKNKTTNEEVLCTKVVVDGFDYYVSDEKIKIDEYYIDDTNAIRQAITECETYWTTRKSYKKLIATNNPSIDIPQIVDEVVSVFKTHFEIEDGEPFPQTQGDKNIIEYFEEGYNEHSKTHTLSDDEVVEFNDWCIKNYCCEILFSGKWYKRNGDDETEYTSKELLQLFKEQQIKTMIYE
jgi:hypothetical protein